MSTLGPLFDEPTYPDAAGYARDSDTSRAAAAHVDDTLSARQARVLSVLAERGPLAAERRENPDTGRTATVWRAA